VIGPRIRSAAFSPIMMVGAFVLPPTMRGHDRRVDHAQALDAVHAQLRIDHVQRHPRPMRQVPTGW
jgi:hypothetical protein